MRVLDSNPISHHLAIGTPIGPHVTPIAATVFRHQATRVTRNVREFSRVTGLHWVNGHATR